MVTTILFRVGEGQYFADYCWPLYMLNISRTQIHIRIRIYIYIYKYTHIYRLYDIFIGIGILSNTHTHIRIDTVWWIIYIYIYIYRKMFIDTEMPPLLFEAFLQRSLTFANWCELSLVRKANRETKRRRGERNLPRNEERWKDEQKHTNP